MKKTRIILCALLIAALAGTTVYANYLGSTKDADLTNDWAALIDQAERAKLFGPESVLEDPTQVTESTEAAAEVYDEYAEKIDEFFTEDYKETVLDTRSYYTDEIEMREEAINGSGQYFLEVLDYGNFEVEVLRHTQNQDTATVYTLFSGWEKIVELTESSEYLVMFPVNKYILKSELVLVDDAWKVSDSTIVSSLLMDADFSLERVFASYEKVGTDFRWYREITQSTVKPAPVQGLWAIRLFLDIARYYPIFPCFSGSY